jgi:thiol-disulfide isomerase/thioredoxin
MHRRRLLLTASLSPLALTPLALMRQARAATVTPFTDAAFKAAQAQGKPILVAIHASWCPICAKQRPIMGQLEAEPGFASLVVLMVDFDTQKDVVQAMGANKQSTLIAFHGTKEMGRSVGVTDPAAIKGLFDKAMA